MRCFLLGFVGFFVAGFVTLVAISSYGNYAARSSVTETLAAVAVLREELADGLLKAPHSPGGNISLPAGALQPIPGASYLKVTSDGLIVVRSAKHGQVVVFEPQIRGTVVTWKCVGAPAKDLPADCR